MRVYGSFLQQHLQFTMDQPVVHATVELYNLMGEKVDSQIIENSNSILINSVGLPKGVYLVRINTDAEILSQRMIIQ
jgi:hypothetical protein